jgi:hypothetical protein
VGRRVRDPGVGTLALGFSMGNPARSGNLSSDAAGGVSEVGLLAVGFFVWVCAHPAQFGNLTSRATSGVAKVWLLAVGLSVLVRVNYASCTVLGPDF